VNSRFWARLIRSEPDGLQGVPERLNPQKLTDFIGLEGRRELAGGNWYILSPTLRMMFKCLKLASWSEVLDDPNCLPWIMNAVAVPGPISSNGRVWTSASSLRVNSTFIKCSLQDVNNQRLEKCTNNFVPSPKQARSHIANKPYLIYKCVLT